MATEIQPGDTYDVMCTPGSTPVLTVGQIFKDGDNPAVVIVDLHDNVATLGPLRVGEISGDIDCSDKTKANFSYKVAAVDANNPPKGGGPLQPGAMPYPSWIWVALALALIFVGLCTWLLPKIWEKKNQKKKKKIKLPPPPPPAPDEAFAAYLREADKGKWSEDPARGRDLFARGYDCLRGYLEMRLSFSAGADTTREFIGSFRAALTLQQHFMKNLPNAPGLVEGLLLQADGVRFAGEAPPTDTKRQFLKSLQDIFEAFNKAAQTAGATTAPLPPKRGFGLKKK